MQLVLDRADEASHGGAVGFPGGGDRPFLGVNVCEAERLELLLGPFGGAHVICGAREARADHVGEMGVVFVGLAVED